MKIRQCTFQVIKGINDEQSLDEDRFMQAVCRIDISESEFRKIHYKKLRQMKDLTKK